MRDKPLDLAELKALADRQRELVETPFGVVRVQSLTAAEMGEYESAYFGRGEPTPESYRRGQMVLVMYAVVDESGARAFNKIGEVSELQIAFVEAVSREVLKLNRPDIEDELKNLETGPNESANSDSLGKPEESPTPIAS